MYASQQQLEQTLQDFGVTYAEWKNYPAKKRTTIKVSKELRREYLDSSGVFQDEKVYGLIAGMAIMNIVAQAKYSILRISGVVTRILDDPAANIFDKSWLKIAIWEQMAFLNKNNNIDEIINAVSVNTPNYQIRGNTSRNILGGDVLGTYTKLALDASEISKYQYFDTQEEFDIYKRNQNGLIEFIEKI